jgi:hypothetical protein
MTIDTWISRLDNEEADKLSQDEQIEIRDMLIELKERRMRDEVERAVSYMDCQKD